MTKKTQKRTIISNYIFKLSLVLLFASVITQLIVTNSSAVKSEKLVEMQERKQALNEEVSDLKLEISNVSSLAVVEEKAKKLGFEEYTQPIAVIEPSQFAAAR